MGMHVFEHANILVKGDVGVMVGQVPEADLGRYWGERPRPPRTARCNSLTRYHTIHHIPRHQLGIVWEKSLMHLQKIFACFG